MPKDHFNGDGHFPGHLFLDFSFSPLLFFCLWICHVIFCLQFLALLLADYCLFFIAFVFICFAKADLGICFALIFLFVGSFSSALWYCVLGDVKALGLSRTYYSNLKVYYQVGGLFQQQWKCESQFGSVLFALCCVGTTDLCVSQCFQSVCSA